MVGLKLNHVSKRGSRNVLSEGKQNVEASVASESRLAIWENTHVNYISQTHN